MKVDSPTPEKRDDPPATVREQTVEEKIAPAPKEDPTPGPASRDASPPQPQQQPEALISELDKLTKTDSASELALIFVVIIGAGLLLFLPDAISARLNSHHRKIFNLFRPYYPAIIFLGVVAYYVYTSDEEAVERLPWHTVMLMPSWIALFITLHPHRVALTMANMAAVLMMVSPPFGMMLWLICLYFACKPRLFE